MNWQHEKTRVHANTLFMGEMKELKKQPLLKNAREMP